jgi:protein-S-isoprenylcysteine O-methyltransferase Ste14
LTFVFLIGWIFGVVWAMLSLPATTAGRLLVTTGPFAVVRHPFYAVSLFFLGLVTIASSRSWVVAAVWPLGYLQARIWVRLLEERSLESAFGEAWRAYAAHTPMFFPRLFRPGLAPRPRQD